MYCFIVANVDISSNEKFISDEVIFFIFDWIFESLPRIIKTLRKFISKISKNLNRAIFEDFFEI